MLWTPHRYEHEEEDGLQEEEEGPGPSTGRQFSVEETRYVILSINIHNFMELFIFIFIGIRYHGKGTIIIL